MLSEKAMRRKILIGVTFAAIMAKPALAQDYQRNFVECTKESGLFLDQSYIQKLQSRAVLRRWYFLNAAQEAAFNDCVARKAKLAPKPSSK